MGCVYLLNERTTLNGALVIRDFHGATPSKSAHKWGFILLKVDLLVVGEYRKNFAQLCPCDDGSIAAARRPPEGENQSLLNSSHYCRAPGDSAHVRGDCLADFSVAPPDPRSRSGLHRHAHVCHAASHKFAHGFDLVFGLQERDRTDPAGRLPLCGRDTAYSYVIGNYSVCMRGSGEARDVLCSLVFLISNLCCSNLYISSIALYFYH